MQERGIIVIDSCALLDLQAAIRPEFGNETAAKRPPQHYLDLLAFLGRQGWRVLIPEMVALESAGVLRNAPNVDDLFSASSRNRETPHNHVLRRWLSQTRDGLLPGVSITPAAPGTEASEYLDSVRRVAADPFYSTKRKCGVLAQVQKKDRRDFGEEACLDEIARQLAVSPEPPPVFLLSDDLGALDETQRRFDDRVVRVNVKGFLTALDQPALAEALSLRHGCHQEMIADLFHQLAASRDSEERDRPYLDTSRPPRQVNDYRFRNAMAALAQTLPVSTGLETAPSADMPKTSRAEQFRRKWNWHGPDTVRTSER